MVMNSNDINTIVLGGGCFWCLEAIYQRVKGVKEVISGYAGGETEEPTYKEVCSGSTGHAEVVKITYDPQIITLEQLLSIFFTIHNPTTLNRQENDIGTQYRSIILFKSKKQKEVVEKVIKEFEQKKIWKYPVVTEVVLLETFYEAEEYHQDYYNENPNQGYCRVIIQPKVTKLRNKFLNLTQTP